MKKLKVITIDFWNTLISSEGSENRQIIREEALIEVLNYQKIEFDKNHFPAIFSKVLEHFKSIWFSEHRTLETKEITTYLLQQFDSHTNTDSVQYLTDVYSNGVIVDPPSLLPNVKYALEILSKNFKLGIVSDTYFSPGVKLRGVLEHHDILQFFSSFSFSNETGVAKPNRKAFENIFNELKLPIRESIHIGDIEKTDILGANSLNIDSILYTGNKTPFTMSLNDDTIIPTYTCETWVEIVDLITNNYIT